MGVEEEVLVIPESRLAALGDFNGFRSFCGDAFDSLLNPEFMQFRPRSTVEDDPSFKQLIPYAILQAEVEGRPALFRYTRGDGQGEKRLHARKSIGIGGHISREDAQGDDLYRSGMQRELAEEIELHSEYEETLVGFIFDDTTAVGRVHLGVVHLLRLDKPAAVAREDDLVDAGFVPVEDLRHDVQALETWSQLCLQHLF